MRNRFFATGAILALLLTFSACQLAEAEGAIESAESDSLIGVFITKEYLDLFDFESYFSDNASDLIDGGEISASDSARYNGRVYATLKSREITREDTGEKFLDWEYVFEDLDGIPFFSAKVTQPDGNSFYGGVSSEEISDGHMSIGGMNELEGTVYLTPRNEFTVYVNPVYQSADGSVYVTSGDGFSCSGVESAGGVYSTTLEETRSVTENGESIEEGSKITVHIAVKNPAKLVRIIQMSADSTALSQEEFAPEKLPESFAPDEGTAYLIIETIASSSEGDIIERAIFEPGDAYTVYTAREDGICVGRFMNIVGDTE